MKELRLRRLYNHGSKKLLITPLDHGMTLGPIEGIYDIRKTVDTIARTKVNAIILHKGNILVCKDILQNHKDMAVILHLSASLHFSPNKERKVLVACVEEAMQLGVDAVSIHINVGNDHDYQMLQDFGKISDECRRWGMPLLAMVYPRGNSIDEKDTNNNMLAARIAMEIGADIVKINYTGDPRSFERIIQGVNIPVVVAGGEFTTNSAKFIKDIKEAIQVGAAGVAIGRNVFQRPDIGNFIETIDEVINPETSPTNSLNKSLIAATKDVETDKSH
jgi:predicted phospho-2-dehydro-3-deoxyheptonate aldolase